MRKFRITIEYTDLSSLRFDSGTTPEERAISLVESSLDTVNSLGYCNYESAVVDEVIEHSTKWFSYEPLKDW